MPSRKKRGDERPEAWIDRQTALKRLDIWQAEEPHRRDWQIPKNPQPIDAIITDLNGATQGSRLRTAANLIRLSTPIACPYAAARAGALLAAVAVQEGMAVRDGALADLYAGYAIDAEKASEMLRVVLGEASRDTREDGPTYPPPVWLANVPRRPSQREDLEEWGRRAEIAYDAQDKIEAAVKALEQLADLARTARAPIKLRGRAGLSEEQIFVEGLGYTWYDLTGSKPSPNNEKFLAFVQMSYKTASEERRNRLWLDPIRRVYERHTDEKNYPGNTPEYDCWDRGEQDKLAPGQKIISLNQPRNETEARIATQIQRSTLIRDRLILAWHDADIGPAKEELWLRCRRTLNIDPESEGHRDLVERIIARRGATQQ